MWKWILGGLLLVVVLLIGTCWYGYNRLTAGGDSTAIAIHAPPERIFASLVNADSMATWMSPETVIGSATHADLNVGDTVHVVERSPKDTSKANNMTWRVRGIMPGIMLEMEIISDSTGQVVLTRRDSLSVLGDSTRWLTRFGAPLVDSLRARGRDSGGKGGGGLSGTLLGMSEKMIVSLMRMQAGEEHKRLKVRIEGVVVVPKSQ